MLSALALSAVLAAAPSRVTFRVDTPGSVQVRVIVAPTPVPPRDAPRCRLTKRSQVIRGTFLRSLGLKATPRGCQVDHVVPLCHCGPDTIENMQLLCGPALAQKESVECK